MEESSEDSDDLAVVAERRDMPVIAHEDFLTELKRDGILQYCPVAKLGLSVITREDS